MLKVVENIWFKNLIIIIKDEDHKEEINKLIMEGEVNKSQSLLMIYHHFYDDIVNFYFNDTHN